MGAGDGGGEFTRVLCRIIWFHTSRSWNDPRRAVPTPVGRIGGSFTEVSCELVASRPRKTPLGAGLFGLGFNVPVGDMVGSARTARWDAGARVQVGQVGEPT